MTLKPPFPKVGGSSEQLHAQPKSRHNSLMDCEGQRCKWQSIRGLSTSLHSSPRGEEATSCLAHHPFSQKHASHHKQPPHATLCALQTMLPQSCSPDSMRHVPRRRRRKATQERWVVLRGRGYQWPGIVRYYGKSDKGACPRSNRAAKREI